MSINGRTRSGFDFSIDERVLDDMELLEAAVQARKGDRSAEIEMIQRLLGTEQKKALYDHLRVDGRVSKAAVGAALVDIFQAIDPAKKS